MRYFSRFLLWLLKWKIHGAVPRGEKKAVIIAAPHTSNWDFVIGRLAYFVIGVRVHFLIKKEVFKWPFGKILKIWGGIPIDRKRSNNMVKQICGIFNKHDSLYVVITPEGTRSRVKSWKKGFYYIALEAKVPIVLGYLDYKKKEGGIGPVIRPSGDFDKDFNRIKEFYRDKSARHPENFMIPE